MIMVEHAMLCTCDECGEPKPSFLIWTKAGRTALCEECTGAMMLEISNIMLPMIATRLEQRRSKL